MKKEFLFLAIFVLSFNLISAISNQEYEMFCQNIDLNNLGEFEIPSYVPYKNEIFNFYLIAENINGSLVVEDGKIISIACVENENVTYNVYIDNFQTIEEIGDAEDFLGKYNEKIANNQIEIKGATFGKKMKLVFTKIALKVASWFR
jgi:hypothetical protein